MSRHSSHTALPLAVRELAVDPADVDRETYPVRVRLTRALTEAETLAFARLDASLRPEGDAVLIPEARLDDVARARHEWIARLEAVQRIGEEIEGEGLLADQRRMDQRISKGSHLRTQLDHDRGLH